MDNWQSLNYQYLINAIAIVGEALYRRVMELQNQPMKVSSDVEKDFQAEKISMSVPSNLENICATFHLSDFERELLLLCAGMELNPVWTSWCAAAQDNPKLDYPTFNMALSILKNPDWNALTPGAALRRWGLIEVGNANILTIAPLRINERILHYLMGISHLDEELLEMMEIVDSADYLVDSHQLVAEQIGKIWLQNKHQNLSKIPIVQLCGGEFAIKRNIAAAACADLGFNLYSIGTGTIPSATNDIHKLIRLWKREYLLNKSVLFLECNTANSDTNKENAIDLLIERIISPLIVSTDVKRSILHSPAVTFDVNKPTAKEQHHIWNQTLNPKVFQLNGFVDTLVSQFNLSSNTIEAVSASTVETESNITIQNQLWNSCRVQARPQLDDLAQRIAPATAWDDLVLPLPQRQILQEIITHVRQKAKVYQNWGFSSKGTSGLGVTALFAGVSGTGKTMAASVLARELNLDLYRIDLSSVVSKYIGETEKNLRRLFDAAEAGGVILLFDEADALFGKRSDVKDSRDRYANMEVSYLLQRMEAYRGLAILTSNLKDSIDTAFMRRIRFIVKFPFPDASQRAEIWQRIFPTDTPLEGLNIKKLAKLNVAGGNIRNIALNAAFLAAEEEQPVMMKHLLQAAESEYIKLERTLTDAEKQGWV